MAYATLFVRKSSLAALAGGMVALAAVEAQAQQDPFLNFLNALSGQPQQQQQQPARQKSAAPQQQQQQPAGDFGALLQGLFGAPAADQQKQAPPAPSGGKTVAPGTGDPIAAALRQIDVAKEIKAKAEALQANVLDVVSTVKVYQAVNGAMWLEIGKQISALNKLDDSADALHVKQFIVATEQKRNAYRSALKSVSLNPSADIAQTNQTLAANTQKVSKLRQSVATLVEAQSAPGSFDKLVRQQNVPVDDMMKAYIVRIEDTVAAMDAAANVFSDMSREYQAAHANMAKAIQTFQEQGSLYTAEITKQVGILALEVARMTEIVNQKNNNAFAMILGVVQGVQILSDLQTMTETMQALQNSYDWFDKNSQHILAGSQAARQELVNSVQTLKTIRPKLVASWQVKMKTMGTVAQKERAMSVKFDQELDKCLARAKAKAPTMAKQDLDEMNFMKKKSLRS